MNRLLFVILAGIWCASLAAQGTVVINEIHSSPEIRQEQVEFVELFNAGSGEQDISSWRLSSAVDFVVPAGTRMAPGGFVVIAANPSAVQAKYALTRALGPWSGALSGEGETVRLLNASGVVVDQVDFGRGFPWPTVGDAPGYSMELIHPALDNSLGGNWRSSVVGAAIQERREVIVPRSTWRYRKGTAEASNPATAWRHPNFDDSAWSLGKLPIGYDPDIQFGTVLSDMRVDGVSAYVTVFLRTRFNLTQARQVHQLELEALYDDGFKLWVNGHLLLNRNMSAGEVSFRDDAETTRESNRYELFDVDVPEGVLRDGENLICVQLANGNQGNSSDCFFDCRLKAVIGPMGRGPTPGRTNVVFALNAPPAIRQVLHDPPQPKSGEVVVVSARVTDPEGVRSVVLQTQIVDPGNYVELDDPSYATTWESTPMAAVGTEGLYVGTLPAGMQVNRRLVRYRLVATDGSDVSIRVPYADDPQPNFAYFVYDGIPEWTGAIRPGDSGPLGVPFTVDRSEMNRLPVLQLLARRQAVEDCTWRDRSHGDEYFWRGTLVYDGTVYDHIRMRPRGGVWRYAMGKNMWKFDFNRGHELQMRDNYGRRFPVPWGKLNLGACIQQGDFQHRGEQGMFESVGFRLFQLAGVPAVDTAFMQFRIVDGLEESVSGDPYAGDFWGLYLAMEQPDGRFLEAHGLPDGNLYKMEGGFGDPNHLGLEGPLDASDLRSFITAYGGTNYLNLSESWWRTHMNLPAYYSYQAIVQAIHHYDIGDGKNYYFYREPSDGRWMSIPWDLDLTWADNMYRGGQSGESPNGGGEPFKRRVLSEFVPPGQHPALQREFRNRVREIRDLLWNTDEAWRLIDEMALRLRGTNSMTLLDADRARWDYNPLMIDPSIVNTNKAGHGRFYRAGVGSKDFTGMVRKMKDYVGYRASNATYSLDTISAEPERPTKPAVVYSGAPGFPANRLGFRSGSYQGSSAAASIQWRLAEITRTNHSSFDPRRAWTYEIEPLWESTFAAADPNALTVSIPSGLVRPGRLYRARVRHVDDQNRASNWSDPVEFTTTDADNTAALVTNLRLTELMYHPEDSGYEFLELFNLGLDGVLDLSGVRFTAGIDYTFPDGSWLRPGEYLILARTAETNFPAFRSYYELPHDFFIHGPYDGSLNNAGETLALSTRVGGVPIFSFTWSDRPPWPTIADGGGFSLVPLAASLPGQSTTNINLASNWRASLELKGSPGREDALVSMLRLKWISIEADALHLEVTVPSGMRFRLEKTSDFTRWWPISEGSSSGTIRVPFGVGEAALFVRAIQIL